MTDREGRSLAFVCIDVEISRHRGADLRCYCALDPVLRYNLQGPHKRRTRMHRGTPKLTEK